MSFRLLKFAALVVLASVAWQLWELRPASMPEWTAEEIGMIRSLSLTNLPPLSPDPSNHVADDPRAAAFGRDLFFDTRLSANGGISCATCHQAERRFTDGLPKGQAIGTVARNSMSIVGSAYSPWQFWDGRRDSLWAQALAPFEDENEHAINRTDVVELIVSDAAYAEQYQGIFGAIDDDVDTVFANAGKAIAAFERTVMPTESRFDRYADSLGSPDADDILSADEARGLQLFIGKANCTQCHNGPLLTNNEFHNTGILSVAGELPDMGRIDAIGQVLDDEFNCRGRFSDDESHICTELEYMRTGIDLVGAFRTPSLRNLENTQPYMHKGQLPDLASVIEHYDEAPDAMIGHNEAKPLDLSARERRQLELFLRTLDAPISAKLVKN